jgi:hypothetical protein
MTQQKIGWERGHQLDAHICTETLRFTYQSRKSEFVDNVGFEGERKLVRNHRGILHPIAQATTRI